MLVIFIFVLFSVAEALSIVAVIGLYFFVVLIFTIADKHLTEEARVALYFLLIGDERELETTWSKAFIDVFEGFLGRKLFQ